LDFQGFTELVDTLGGLTVNVEKTIDDPLYPDEKMVGYSRFTIKAGVQKLDGKTALKYTRSRETTSDFDRSKRQMQVLQAVKEKAISLGILSNPKKIADLTSIMGNHLRTDLGTQEFERLIAMAKDFKTDQVVTRVLDNSPDGPLVSSNGEQGFILKPKAGNFKEIQRIAHEIFTDPYLTEEGAKIQIINASSNSGLGQKVAQLLKDYGYKVTKIETALKESDNTVIFDYTQGRKPYTIKFLTNRLKAEAVSKVRPTGTTVDISVILGDDYLD
jgi:hypothetical protein